MNFRKGQKILRPKPLIASLEYAYLWDTKANTGVALEVVHITTLLANRKRYTSTAWPMQVALAMGENAVHLWPTPHKGGEIKLRYYPPMEEV